MDVDQSIQTRRINYANRPNFNQYQGIRPHPASGQAYPPNKMQRINNELYSENIQSNTDEEMENINQYMDEYLKLEENQTNDNEFSDIHFLD